MTTYRHTEDMGEISGFGGEYEECCQDMLEAGMKWIEEHTPDNIVVKENPNIFGICFPEGEASEALSKAVIDAANGEATGAMHHTIMSRLAWISKNGWDAYCTELRKDEEN